MAVELLGGVGHVLDLGRDGEAQRPQLPHLPQERDQALAVVDPHLAVLVVQLHQPPVRLQAGISRRRKNNINNNNNNNEERRKKKREKKREKKKHFNTNRCSSHGDHGSSAVTAVTLINVVSLL